MKDALRIFEREIEQMEKGFDIFTVDVSKYCEDIMSRKDVDDTKKIDGMLRLDATLYMHLGVGSKKSEREETKKKSRVIYRAIKTIDKALGDSFLSHQDKT